MSLFALLKKREAIDKPIRIGVIGAGTFSSAFLNQVKRVPGMKVVGVADLDGEKARRACVAAGWPETAVGDARSPSGINEGAVRGKVMVTDSADHLIQADLEVVVEATGVTEAGTYHAWNALEAGKHVVMANVETDVLSGPILRKKADERGLVYSMAYGDQPGIICEMVDWARTTGLEVVCAGKGTRYQPEYRYSTPKTVWEYFGFTEEQVSAGNYNAQMYNSFLDSTKSCIEMCALSNATGLIPQKCGLQFPPVGPKDLPGVLKPKAAGGLLEHSGTVEIVASENQDGTPIKDHLRWGVYIVFKAGTDFIRRFLTVHDFLRDESGEYGAVYRPFHLIGIELGVSVASVVLRGEATGSAEDFVADVASIAKKDLRPGDVLDGEGGYTVFGRLVTAEESLANKYLPMGLSRGAKMIKPVSKDSFVTYDHVKMDEDTFAFKLRKTLEENSRKRTP
ncbi:MAG TPA: Gfo/Idh/MocA family oxidoreductase [Thermodesulfobacteriota bacterium]|nr:Gfo/Idh/MocA family oxidoreductase [Thermodesulfobacteriota bacterium]